MSVCALLPTCLGLFADLSRSFLDRFTGFLTSATSFLFSIASHAVWLFITWIFWCVSLQAQDRGDLANSRLSLNRLAGAAAITNTLGGGLNCDDYPGAHCNQLNAAEAFAWINWILATFAFAVILFVGARSARSGNGFGTALIA